MSDLNFSPVCPYCGYEFDQDETWESTYSDESRVYTGDGDESEVKCHNEDCGKRFMIECHYVAKFKSEPLE